MQEIDARWLMAYSAALGETDPRCFDTGRAEGVLAHPLFPVCYEWPISGPIRQIPALRELYPRLVHAEHDLVLHRLPRAGDRLAIRARIAAAAPRKAGAYVVFAFEARDEDHRLVSETRFGVIYRGVALDDAAGTVEALPVADAVEPVGRLEIARNAAHVYTECARIFNPIHTDLAYARAAGLPDIILHGTATLALSVSKVLGAHKIEKSRVKRIRCRFSGMVRMPSTLEVLAARGEGYSCFETRGAITRGRIDHG